MSDGEMAWTSFNKVTRQVTINRAELIKQKTFHPTEKPVKLYKWILKNYANEGDKILDTHLGSGSIAVACDVMNFDLVGCEIDIQYYEKANKRFDNERSQLKMF